MSERRCATAGCTGTLPAGTGTHCPRCGGTQFLARPRKGRWLLLLLASIAGVVVGVVLLTARHERAPATATPLERQPLVDAHELASQMTNSGARDDAYADIVRRALLKRDYEYACQVAGEMTIASNRDKTLLRVVDESLQAREPHWAKLAAENMIQANDRDAALRRIMDAAQGKDEMTR